MKKILLLMLLFASKMGYSQSIENADNCLIWVASLKPYATFAMTEDEMETTKILKEKKPEVFIQGVVTASNDRGEPIYLVVYTRGQKGFENVAFLEYVEFIDRYLSKDGTQ